MRGSLWMFVDAAELLLRWGLTVASVYAILVATYIAACLVVGRLNRRIAAAKIQPRETPPHGSAATALRALSRLPRSPRCSAPGIFCTPNSAGGFGRLTGLPGPALSFVLSLVLFDTWFYWFHRLIHTRCLYRRVHRWHHLTVTPVVWSNNSDRLVDNLFLQSYWLVAHFLVPAAPAVLLAHKIYDQITGIVGHSGWEHGGALVPAALASDQRHASRPAPPLFPVQLRDAFHLVGPRDGHAPPGSRCRAAAQPRRDRGGQARRPVAGE